MLVWFLLVIIVVTLVAGYGRRTDEDVSLPGSTAQHGRDLLEAHFPGSGQSTGQVLFRSSGPPLDATAIAVTARRIAAVPHVESVGPLLLATGGTTGYLDVQFDVGPRDITKDLTTGVLGAAATDGLQVLPAGALARLQTDTRRSEALGIVVALVVLVIAFGGLVAAALPLLTAAFTLVCAIGAIGLAGHLTAVPSVATTLGTMIGLGVGVDYALFLITRYRALLTAGAGTVPAIVDSVASSGSAIVFAGGTVIVALCGLAVAGVPILATLGWTAGLVVLTAVVREGLAATGMVITSAALIMVCVFTSFVLSSSPVIKMMGLGLAVAIAVDATVIRGLLVPATMVLLGKAN